LLSSAVRVLVIALIGVVIFFVGFGLGVVSTSSTTLSLSPSRQETTTQMEPVSMQGQGSQAKQINLSRGLATFAFSYKDDPSQKGAQFWSIKLLDSEGKQVETISADIGTNEGSKAVRIPQDGTYTVNVEAPGGSWTLDAK
jgi:hypothetical protein